MRPFSGGLTGLVRRRIFLKYILATLIAGVVLNAVVLVFYYQHRRAQQTGQVAAEIATLGSRVGGAAAALVRDGEIASARALLSVFAANQTISCADLFLEVEASPAVSWPVIGCARMRVEGQEISVPLPGAGAEANLAVRIDEAALRAELRAEFLVLSMLGLVGGLSLVLAGIAAFVWFINRPLALLLRAIGRFERHDDPQKVDYASPDEIGRVVASYNAMLDREVERVGEIKDAHREILESVGYATRIQRGLLPPTERMEAAFGAFAAVWQPRDLVGGDIYWVFAGRDRTTLALLDCTGHGVPGGFMTMLAVATLERIFAEDDTLSPGAIMARLSDHTRRLLNQDAADPTSNDGMDAAVCQLDRAAGTLTFAGARLSMLIAAGGAVERLRGDRMSLGYPDTPSDPCFKERTVTLTDDALVVLTTDGIIDQPGGRAGRAFGYRRLMAEIHRHATDSPDAMLEAVRSRFERHAEGEARRDDLTMLAFRAPSSATA